MNTMDSGYTDIVVPLMEGLSKKEMTPVIAQQVERSMAYHVYWICSPYPTTGSIRLTTLFGIPMHILPQDDPDSGAHNLQ